MAGNKKPKKAYKPKQRFQNPILYATENQMLLIEYDRNYVAEIKIRNHSAMTSLLMGNAVRQEIDTIAAAYNMVFGITHAMKLPVDTNQFYTALLERAALAFKDLCLRANKLGKPIAKAAEIGTLNTLIEALDDLLGVVSVRQFELGVKHAINNSKGSFKKQLAA